MRYSVSKRIRQSQGWGLSMRQKDIIDFIIVIVIIVILINVDVTEDVNNIITMDLELKQLPSSHN